MAPEPTPFVAPPWLRNLGRTSWLLVGVGLLLIGLFWLLDTTSTIVMPVLAATIVAVVTIPIVDALARHMPRWLGAVLVLLAFVALAVVILLLVLAGISDQKDEIASAATKALDRVEGWAQDAGVDKSTATSAGNAATQGGSTSLSTLLHGLLDTVLGVASLALGLSFAALSLIFMLIDGPKMRTWIEANAGLPTRVTRTIIDGLITSLRGYFRGVTIIAAFNGVVIGIGALILGVPLAGTIAIVAFVTAYVPYIGAFIAGAFAVVIALGASGTTTAIIMLVIVLLANGLLQNIVQPFAMGAALDLNPLVVLVVTIAAGCIFGTMGLVLAAPLVSASVHITRNLRGSVPAVQ